MTALSSQHPTLMYDTVHRRAASTQELHPGQSYRGPYHALGRPECPLSKFTNKARAPSANPVNDELIWWLAPQTLSATMMLCSGGQRVSRRTASIATKRRQTFSKLNARPPPLLLLLLLLPSPFFFSSKLRKHSHMTCERAINSKGSESRSIVVVIPDAEDGWYRRVGYTTVGLVEYSQGWAVLQAAGLAEQVKQGSPRT